MMTRFVSAIIPLVSATALVACSGGASSGGNGGGLTLDRDTVALTAVEGAEPAQDEIRISISAPDAAYVVAGNPPGTAAAPWLDLSLWGSGSTWTVSLVASTAGLAPGIYSTTLRVGVARKDQTVIATRDARVTFTVTTGVTALPSATLPTDGVAGSSFQPTSRPVHVVGTSGTAWTATSDAPWALPGKLAGTVPDQFDVSFDSTGLAPGTYHAHVTVAGGGTSATVLVTLTLTAPPIAVTPATVALGGASGHDVSGRTASVTVGTGTNGYAFTATAADAWLEITPASGTASSTPVTLTFSPTAAARGLPPGTYATDVTVSTAVAGQTLTRTVPVTLTLDEHRLLVSRTGVGFVSVPGIATLTRALRLRSNRGVAAGWTASSDQPWLTVTSGGTTADPLVLTADPSGLATDALHLATVTITPVDTGLPNIEHVQVGLWVGSVAPADLTVSTPFTQLAADPVRPYLYVNDGGTDVTAVHAYSGATVATFSGVAEKLGAMSVSGDGSTLYVVDEGTSPRVVPVRVDTGAVGTPWALASRVQGCGTISWVRSDGVGLVLVAGRQIRNTSTEETYAVPFDAVWPGDIVTASEDGSVMCGATSQTTSPPACRSLDATSTTGAPILGEVRRADYAYPGYARDVAVSADGSRAYVPDGFVTTIFGPTSPGTTIPALGTLVGSYGVAVEISADDRIFAATGDRAGSNYQLLVYGPDGAQQSAVALGAEPADAQLAVTGDARRVAVIRGRYPASDLRILTAP